MLMVYYVHHKILFQGYLSLNSRSQGHIMYKAYIKIQKTWMWVVGEDWWKEFCVGHWKMSRVWIGIEVRQNTWNSIRGTDVEAEADVKVSWKSVA